MATPPIAPATPDPRNATIGSGKRAVQITAQQVQPPSPLYLQVEDNLICSIYIPTASTPVYVYLMLRWLRPDGEIVSIRKTIPTQVGTITNYPFTLGEGFLLSAAFNPIGLSFNDWGKIYASLTIQRDLPEGGSFFWQLFGDYATTFHYPTWPYGRNIQPQDAAGRIRSITGSTPAVGAEINEVVPSQVRWSLLSFRARLTTSAVAANRKPDLLIDDGANAFYQAGNGNSLTASITWGTTWANTGYAGAASTSADNTAPLAPLLLEPGFRIRTQTLSIDAGDQWQAPQYLVQEWIAV
jgi:hypothetical protein